jgi:pimeloyl-ACP methyl ester carboxylesterase
MAEGKARVGEIELWWEDFGSRANPTVLLVMGANAQAVFWPPVFLERLVAAGYHVVRFDNRDIGLSTWIDWSKRPYTVADMAGDAVGLLGALGIERAHWVGVSMGGMIAQQAALDAPERVRSLVSIMSSPSHPGDPELPGMAPQVQEAIDAMQSGALGPVEGTVRLFAALAGSRAPFDEALFRAGFEAGLARGGFNPACAHGLAVNASPSRRERLASLRIPALVIHGDEDPILPLAHGEATAAAIPGAKLVVLRGVGHDFPESALPEYVDAILGHLAAHR